MSHSGVVPSDECLTAFNDLKLRKKYQWLEMKIELPTIQIGGTGAPVTGDPVEAWNSFAKENCKPSEPAFFVYDFAYDGPKSKLVFLQWNPDSAPIKKKMVYASSVEALKSKLPGIVAVQATDAGEVDFAYIKSKVA
eukprot:TRINITY_DN39700_c0_g1_i1.p1 TRINITY_DN39700_c0_g1~~TRINITY_DN39700_c0_g1_i1.p1  ORF type:complete len:137 (-),score=33.07 TRINITY_DN39700_c0_g1_i1:168-578(-)